jgi:hypothetical protein
MAQLEMYIFIHTARKRLSAFFPASLAFCALVFHSATSQNAPIRLQEQKGLRFHIIL